MSAENLRKDFGVIAIKEWKMSASRNSHQRCSMKKSVLRNFTKFAGKHLCQSLFFNKVGGLRPEFCEISKNTFFAEHLWWLLLNLLDE